MIIGATIYFSLWKDGKMHGFEDVIYAPADLNAEVVGSVSEFHITTDRVDLPPTFFVEAPPMPAIHFIHSPIPPSLDGSARCVELVSTAIFDGGKVDITLLDDDVLARYEITNERVTLVTSVLFVKQGNGDWLPKRNITYKSFGGKVSRYTEMMCKMKTASLFATFLSQADSAQRFALVEKVMINNLIYTDRKMQRSMGEQLEFLIHRIACNQERLDAIDHAQAL